MKKLYVVTLEAEEATLNRFHLPPVEQRLKRLLKHALRSCGFVCVDLKEIAVGDVPQDRKTPTE